MKNNQLRKMIVFIVFSLTISLTAKYKLIEVKPTNMGKKINSKGDDYSPSFTADGFTMIFSSKRDGQKYQNIYIFTTGKSGMIVNTGLKKVITQAIKNRSAQ